MSKMTSRAYSDGSEPRHRFEHLFNSLKDGVVEIEIVDGEPIVRNINPAFEDVFGYPEDDILGESLNEFIVPTDYADEAADLDSRTADGKYNDRIVTRLTADGERTFLYRGVPFERDGNQYAFAIYSDITEQKEREEKLERKNQQLDEFASILTHDLRNPINIAEGYLEQLNNPENEEYIEVIQRAHNRMKAIIDDTLVLTKETEAVTAVEPIEVAELAASSWELVETGASELCIDDEFVLYGDEERVARLFENLFRNAIDHNDCPVTVSVGIHESMTTATRSTETNRREFYIEDTGCGIPKGKRDEVFAVGETTSRNGTGLGLSICERIVDAHGWEVSVTEGLTGGGAKFIFRNVELER